MTSALSFLIMFSMQAEAQEMNGLVGLRSNCPKNEASLSNRRIIDIVRNVAAPVGPLVPNVIGRCHEGESSEALMTSNLGKDVEGAFKALGRKSGYRTKDEFDPKSGSYRRVAARPEDWLAFDMVFRTLIAEVGTRRCPLASVMAVGKIMLNRRDFVGSHASGPDVDKVAWEFVAVVDDSKRGGDSFVDKSSKRQLDQKLNDIMQEAGNTNPIGGDQNSAQNEPPRSLPMHPLIPILKKRQQFSAWNLESGSRHNIVCPEKFSYQGDDRLQAIADIAANIVFNEKEFRRQTQSVTALYYTSGKDMTTQRTKEGYRKLTDQTVNGSPPIADPACIELWSNPKFDPTK
jgi:hypothetical protein